MKLGIALGGGGARGFAHIGILQVLDEAGIHFDAIAGTSIGSLIGAVYANRSLARLTERSKQIRFFEIPQLLSPAWSFSGAFSGKKALDFLREFVSVENIEDLKIPYAAVCADVYSGEVVTISSGNLLEATRASFSIPLIFTPIPKANWMLVDGGMLDPVPVKAAKDLGAEIVIAVDLFGHLEHRQKAAKGSGEEVPKSTFLSLDAAMKYLGSISSMLSLRDLSQEDDVRKPNYFEMLERTLAISQQQLTKYRLSEFPPDVLLQPEVANIGLLDFHRGVEGIKAGRECAERMLPEIKKVLAQTR
ncbi:MAG: patatin-like phospholipase family protein [Bdellovibrionales bacterium]|nr:patatin-like phospholipase family protein [Bdellovibrionales bacterium]